MCFDVRDMVVSTSTKYYSYDTYRVLHLDYCKVSLAEAGTAMHRPHVEHQVLQLLLSNAKPLSTVFFPCRSINNTLSMRGKQLTCYTQQYARGLPSKLSKALLAASKFSAVSFH